MPTREARRLPKFASKIVKVVEFTSLLAPFLGPFKQFLICVGPPPQYLPRTTYLYYEIKLVSLYVARLHCKWPRPTLRGPTLNGQALL